jgi:RNA polymerase sigma factor (sigma-70 family)
MNEGDGIVRAFEAERPHLRAVAYRMLGSTGEADDAVQEAWLRLSRSDAAAIENLGGWLTTVVARICLNMLRSRNSRREQPLDDVRVPDPIIDPLDGTDPEREALLADSVGIAMLMVLETLNPAERLAFVLHDMFAVPFEEIAEIVDRSPDAARQLASRGRRRLRAASPAPDADLAEQREVVEAFIAAAREGDFDRLVNDAEAGEVAGLAERLQQPRRQLVGDRERGRGHALRVLHRVALQRREAVGLAPARHLARLRRVELLVQRGEVADVEAPAAADVGGDRHVGERLEALVHLGPAVHRPAELQRRLHHRRVVPTDLDRLRHMPAKERQLALVEAGHIGLLYS